MAKKDRLYAVSHISFFENEMRTVFVITQGDEMDALRAGFQQMFPAPVDVPEDEYLTGFEECETLKEAKEIAFNMDSMVEVQRFSRSAAVKV